MFTCHWPELVPGSLTLQGVGLSPTPMCLVEGKRTGHCEHRSAGLPWHLTPELFNFPAKLLLVIEDILAKMAAGIHAFTYLHLILALSLTKHIHK